MKIHNVGLEDLTEFKKLGFDLTAKEAIEFSIHGVNAGYIRDLEKYDLQLSPSELVTGRIHGVTPDFVGSLKKLNLEGLDFKHLKEARIHDVSAAFIEKARAKGHSPKHLADYTRLKISGI